MAFNLLCCDGGGIRGLITALLIQQLDKQYAMLSSTQGYAGTSTGGLIALALASDIDIAEIVGIYENEGKKIFTPNQWLLEEGRCCQGTPESVEGVKAGPGITVCQYTNTGLKTVARQLLGTATLSSSEKFVAVNSARLWDQNGWEPCCLANTPSNEYKNVSMVDASLATSAAPTYFPPYPVGDFGYFADGGTFANNPTMSALGEVIAARLAGGLQELRVLSIGTGLSPEGIPPGAIKNPLDWGMTHWMWPEASGGVPATALLNLALDCSASVAAVQAQRLLGDNYCRANFILPKSVPLDDWKDTPALISYTQDYMKTTDWSRVCSWVEQNWAA